MKMNAKALLFLLLPCLVSCVAVPPADDRTLEQKIGQILVDSGVFSGEGSVRGQ